MVYFDQRSTPKKRKDPTQSAKVEMFKQKFGVRALYHTYTDLTGFEAAFRQHLAGAMNELLKRFPAS